MSTQQKKKTTRLVVDKLYFYVINKTHQTVSGMCLSSEKGAWNLLTEMVDDVVLSQLEFEKKRSLI
jgi:hypothetical protein